MSAPLVAALIDALDDQALDQLAALLAPRLNLQPGPTSPWLNVDEAASYLRCSRQAIYDRVHDGALKPSRDGRRLLFNRAALDAYLANNTTT